MSGCEGGHTGSCAYSGTTSAWSMWRSVNISRSTTSILAGTLGLTLHQSLRLAQALLIQKVVEGGHFQTPPYAGSPGLCVLVTAGLGCFRDTLDIASLRPSSLARSAPSQVLESATNWRDRCLLTALWCGSHDVARRGQRVFHGVLYCSLLSAANRQKNVRQNASTSIRSTMSIL